MPESRQVDHEYFEIQRVNSDQESMWDDFKFGNYGLYAEYRNDFFQYEEPSHAACLNR